MRFTRVAARTVLTGLLSALCSAAHGQPAAGASQANAAQNTPATVLRTQAFTVLVDVVATRKGQAVLGLSQKQFHVLEDGHEQSIAFFEEHKPGAPTVKHATLPPNTYNNLPSEPPGSAVNVLLLDALNTPLGNQMEVRRQMVQYMETIRPGTMMAIFTLTSRLRMVQGFTSDVSVLTAALKGANANPKQSTALDAPNGSAFDSAISNLQMMSGAGAAVAAMQNFQSANDSFQTDQRATLTLEALQQLGRYLSAVPGRKNLIWFSGSFPISVDPTDITNPAAGSRNYQLQVRDTADILTAARVAVYPMDAAGLATLAAFDVGNDGLGDGPKDPSVRGRFTMEELAQRTGGIALYNNNSFAAGIALAIDNGSSYYTIGYAPADKNFHGQFRKLKVRIDDCDCELEYRSGYYADPPDKPSVVGLPPASVMTTATLHGAPPSTQILFQARVLPETDPLMKDVHLPAQPIGAMTGEMKKPFTRYITDIVVDPRTMTFGAAADGAHEDAIEFTLVAYDGVGKRVNYVDRTTRIALSASQYGQIMASGLPVRLAMELPRGNDFLVIAVHDMNSAKVGSIEIPLAVPDK
jgi:VWFA-related protein